jgi:hypothetical protein
MIKADDGVISTDEVGAKLTRAMRVETLVEDPDGGIAERVARAVVPTAACSPRRLSSMSIQAEETREREGWLPALAGAELGM